MRAGDDVMRCVAQVLMRDDRWGGMRVRCELDADHTGDHSHAMTACEPIAHLRWKKSYSCPHSTWVGRKNSDRTFCVSCGTETTYMEAMGG